MSDTRSTLPDRLLAEKNFYIPWNAERPVYTLGLPLARRLQEVDDRPITVVCPDASNAPVRAVATSVVTEREGTVVDGGIVLAYCPSHQLARKFVHLENSLIIVAEWRKASFLGWARLVGAHNVVTGELLSDGLSADGRRAVDQIVACGDLSWTDAPARSTVNSCLDRLTALDELAPEVIVARARHEWGANPARALGSILTEYGERPPVRRPAVRFA